MDFLQVLADIFGSILNFFKQILSSIGAWTVDWVTAATIFFKDNLSTGYTFYIVICVMLVIAGIVVNIIWPGDKPGPIFKRGAEKIEELEGKIEKTGEKGIIDDIKRCKDCGNPVGDAEICPLCGTRQI